MIGAILLAVGMTLFSMATSVNMLVIAGVVYGLSIGINMPAILHGPSILHQRKSLLRH